MYLIHVKYFLTHKKCKTILQVGFGATYGENVLAKLNSDIKDMNSLINRIQNHYREESFRNPDLIYPDNYGETLRRATDTIGKALRIIEQYEGTNQRLSDDYFDGK